MSDEEGGLTFQAFLWHLSAADRLSTGHGILPCRHLGATECEGVAGSGLLGQLAQLLVMGAPSAAVLHKSA